MSDGKCHRSKIKQTEKLTPKAHFGKGLFYIGVRKAALKEVGVSPAAAGDERVAECETQQGAGQLRKG